LLHRIYDYGLPSISIVLALLVAYAAFTRARRASAASDGEIRFRILAEAIPQIVWTALPGEGMDYCNQRLCDLTGLLKEDVLGSGWQKLLHPDDLPLALENWENSRRTGSSYDVEYRLRTAAGGYRWHLVRATPMRDPAGTIVKWFGACTDIDDQMRNQQVLEEQVKQHTTALMEANTRLQSEMHERALAQQELNQQTERMMRELTKRSNRATNLAKMAELLQSCSEEKDAFSVLAGMAPKIFTDLRGAVLMFDSSHQKLEVGALWSKCDLPPAGFGPHDCWALRTGHTHVVVAGDHTAECGHATSGQYSYICLPLLSHGEAIGVLHFQMIAEGELQQAVLALANMFAEQVSLSLANIRLREALRSQSIRDPLTSLYNRRYLEEMMDRETRRAIRADSGLGVLMLDLDHFKSFNDTFGHDAGDAVLRETASFLTKSVRAEDIVCRFGGEEFMILLPGADLTTTKARAERIRSRVRDLTVVHDGQSLGTITVSVGVAEAPEHGTSPQALIAGADAALYRAKREGRDRVMIADAAVETDSHLDAVGKKKA
jgi:diguanylate cyclase (GGDEF)-like protein/PAS domain S-box-containing protein